jgi:UDP-N-acetylglucosamine transferase subunit ALG13
MDYFIPLAGANEPQWGEGPEQPLDYFCRQINPDEVKATRKRLDPDHGKSIVYFGLGMKIGIDDISKLPIWDSENCLFLVSGNTAVEGKNIVKIPEDVTETQNYIAACDLVISKPGWATVSEAVRSERPLLVIERGFMREDRNTIDYLLSRNMCRVISWPAFKEFKVTDDLLDELKSARRSEGLSFEENQVILSEISEKILSFR